MLPEMRSLVISVALTAAMTAQSQMTPTSETMNVTVTEVDAVVLDAQGKPVSGLTGHDFELTVGRRRRTITNFYAIQRGTNAEAPGATATKGATSPLARRNYLVLFVDDLHIHQRGKKRALDALRNFVRQTVGPGIAAMLVVSKGDVRIARTFTEDPDLLIRSIDALEKQPAQVSEYESARRDLLRLIDTTAPENALIVYQQMLSLAEQERSMAERTIAALERVIHSTAGLDGRRVLVYLSDGLPMQPAAEIFQYYRPELYLTASSSSLSVRTMGQFQQMDAMSVDLSSKFHELGRESAAAGVQFFAIDSSEAHGFEEMSPEGPTTKRPIDSSLIRANLHGPIQFLADETGGRAIIDQNDLNAAFAQLGDHLSTYYSLGFRSDGSNREEDVKVRVRKRGLTVLTTKHVRERSGREQIEDRVRAALYAPVEQNPLEVKLAVAPRGGSEPGVSAIIRIPVSRLSIFADEKGSSWFAVYVMMMDQDMRETPAQMIQHKILPSEEAEAVQRLSISADPGKYIVSFAVVDAYSWQATYMQREVTIPKVIAAP
jgi:VWFA-related protein